MASRRSFGFGVRFLVVATVLVGIVLLLNRLMSEVRIGRFDLTEDKIHTVSDASKEILAKLEDDVKVKLYMTRSEEMPAGMKNLERDLVDRLAEFHNASDGKLTYEVYDPSDNDEMIEQLKSLQIVPFDVQSIQRDEVGLKRVWAAMVISYLTRDEVIPRLMPQLIPSLEYEMLSRVHRLQMEGKPKVAVIAPVDAVDPQLAQMMRQMGRPVPESRDNYRRVAEMLRQNYDVTRTDLVRGNPMPPDVDTLLVLDPRDLNERQVWEIARAIRGGANAVVAVQQNSYSYDPGQAAGRPGTLTLAVMPRRNRTGLDDLLTAYGAAVDKDLFMDRQMAMLQIEIESNAGGTMPMRMVTPVKVPVQVLVAGDQFNRDLSITDRLPSLLYLWGSPVVVDQPRVDEMGIDSTVLFTSSDESWTVPARTEPLAAADMDPAEYAGRQPLAVLLEGQFPDPFEGKDRPEWPEPAAPDRPMPPDPPAEPVEPAAARVILVGSGRMFDDNGLMADSNRYFLLNSVDALSLGEELINIRAKLIEQRLIEKDLTDGGRGAYKLAVMLAIPALLVLFGVVRFMIRRRRQQVWFDAAA